MQVTAVVIKALSVVLQYGMLFFLLFFVYRAARWWRIFTRKRRLRQPRRC